MQFLTTKQWTNGSCLKFTSIFLFFEAIYTFVSPPSTSCFYKSSAGVKWCTCIEQYGATTVENVALYICHLCHPCTCPQASPSLQPRWHGDSWKWWRKGRLKREMGSCSKEQKSLPSSWLPLSSHLKGSAAWEATRANGFVLTCASAIIFLGFLFKWCRPI